MVQQSNNKIRICAEANSTIPVVVGKCPNCARGERSLVLLGYVPSVLGPSYNDLFFSCICCHKVITRKVFEVAEV